MHGNVCWCVMVHDRLRHYVHIGRYAYMGIGRNPCCAYLYKYIYIYKCLVYMYMCIVVSTYIHVYGWGCNYHAFIYV